MMEKIVVLLAIASLVSGIQYDGFRVKFGWSDALADKEYFFNIPRTKSEAESKGWKLTEGPPGPLQELIMYCSPGRIICPKFDTQGFVAGLQIAIPADEYDAGPNSPEKKFVKWSAPASMGEPAREFWTATQYLVSEESLKSGAGPTIENGATLQDGGVWVAGPDGRLMRIPSTEAELSSTPYKKQNCIPNMGIHYYYNMTPEMNCENLFPWVALVTQGELIGTQFQAFGKLTKTSKHDWFEPPLMPLRGINITLPYAPECFGNWIGKHGFLSMHIYYVKEPWTIKCSDGDSAKPGSPVDRLMFNGYRYARQISDEIKGLFSG